MTARASQWDVLKKHHRFVRDDEEPQDVSWEERLARAYESKLFKEFALVDLKHYKSKRFALRWRTATEVVNGIGDETCASLRCAYHDPKTQQDALDPRSLRTFELPFVYEEEGKRKECLVKVRVCRRCAAKLEWRPHDERDKERERSRRSRDRDRDRAGDRDGGRARDRDERGRRHRDRDREDGDKDRDSGRDRDRERDGGRRSRREREGHRDSRSRSRSRSPARSSSGRRKSRRSESP